MVAPPPLDPAFDELHKILALSRRAIPVRMIVETRKHLDDQDISGIIECVNDIVLGVERDVIMTTKFPVGSEISLIDMKRLLSQYGTYDRGDRRFLIYRITRGSVIIEGAIVTAIGVVLLAIAKSGWDKSNTKATVDAFVAEKIDSSFDKLCNAIKSSKRWLSSGVIFRDLKVIDQSPEKRIEITFEKHTKKNNPPQL